MNEKEYQVKLCEHDVREQETKVREAKIAMEQGYKKMLAELEYEYSKLKAEYERELIRLEKEKQHLRFAKEEVARGYEA